MPSAHCESLPILIRPLWHALQASHTVTGRGRDWRSVFHQLSNRGTIGSTELQEAVHEVAGPGKLGQKGELEEIVRQFDASGSGRLSYVEFEAMLSALLPVLTDSSPSQSGVASPLQPERYTTRSIWLSSLRNIGGSQVLRGIMPPLLAVTCTSALVAVIHCVSGALPVGRASKALAQMHSLLGGALSLLLVFRTNAAYNRFWEARRIWEALLNRIRELARFTWLYQLDAGVKRTVRSRGSRTRARTLAFACVVACVVACVWVRAATVARLTITTRSPL